MSAKVCRCVENVAKSTGNISFARLLGFGSGNIQLLTEPKINAVIWGLLNGLYIFIRSPNQFDSAF